jgi:hypothetical protein
VVEPVTAVEEVLTGVAVVVAAVLAAAVVEAVWAATLADRRAASCAHASLEPVMEWLCK